MENRKNHFKFKTSILINGQLIVLTHHLLKKKLVDLNPSKLHNDKNGQTFDELDRMMYAERNKDQRTK